MSSDQPSPDRHLLLVSNSTMWGRGYFEHCAAELLDFLGSRRHLLFIPWALDDLDGYAAKVSASFALIGLSVDSIHQSSDPVASVDGAEAIFIGGGNTFRLLARLYQSRLIDPIRRRVSAGVPYVGSSAGTGISAPTLKTTNDMPIVEPPSFDALGLIPFQINAHYLDADPSSRHMGETRETRIREFHEMNEAPVLGLREGGWLRVDGTRAVLGGESGARLFRRGAEPEEIAPLTRLDALLR